MTVLITGGAGYIGTHTIVELLAQDKEIVVLDNFTNSSKIALDRVRKITGKEFPQIEGDVRNKEIVQSIFRQYDIEAVIHFAGLKSVGESLVDPLSYYHNNICGVISLCEVMAEFNVYNLVFSSSAAVYGNPNELPIKEDAPIGRTTNPYGTSKYMAEAILQDLYKANHQWNIVILRYFNPVGAHESGLIGEDPRDKPNNLLPFISQVAAGKRTVLHIYGDNYDTYDGTGIRDYIHVVDLALGHLSALNNIKHNENVAIYNLGTGQGVSVLDMVLAFEKYSKQKVPYRICSRREGDIERCYAHPEKAEKELDWKAIRGLEEMVVDTWRWQSQNPNGYEE